MENPITRTEQYLSAIAGNNNPVPDTPITREEQYLAAILENGSGADLSVIAPEYDPEDTYSEGDMRTHDGKLYKANQDISTAEEWTAAHWTETDIASEMGNASGMEKVAVSGSTPSITAESNKLYICGECSTLSITPPASGICGVIFESGSTATVLTLGSGITCPDWFDPENLEADTIYELNINEGLLTVGMWGAS